MIAGFYTHQLVIIMCVCVFIYLLINLFICILKPNNLHVIHSYTSTPLKISFFLCQLQRNYPLKRSTWGAATVKIASGRHLDALDRLGDDQGQSPDLNVSGQYWK